MKPKMPTATKTTANNEAVRDALRKALRAVEAAQKAGYEVVRTSSTLCTDYIDSALNSLN